MQSPAFDSSSATQAPFATGDLAERNGPDFKPFLPAHPACVAGTVMGSWGILGYKKQDLLIIRKLTGSLFRAHMVRRLAQDG